MGLLDSFLSPDDASSVQGSGLGTGLSAIGMALMSGNSRAPFANLPQAYASVASSEKQTMSRAALKQLLIQKGYSEAEADKYSTSETATKLALQEKENQGFEAMVKGGFGGGAPAPASPSMSPAAPAGPAAGVSLNGGGQIPGSLNLAPTDEDTAIRTVLAEAGNQGPDGMKAVAGVLRNRALLAGTSVAAEALKPNQFEPWNANSGNDPRRFKVDSPEYQAAKALVVPVLRGEAPDPTGGGTHFYAPKAQAALGRNAPKWDDGTGVDLGDHRFFRRPYAGKDPSALAVAGAPMQVASADPLAGFVPSPGGGADNPDPGAAADRSARPVQVANDENQTQILEGRMGMLPKSVYGIVPPTQAAADAPVSGAAEAAFEIPPGSGAQPAPRYGPDTTTGRAIAARQQASAADEERQINEGLAKIAMSGRYGEKGKAYAEAIKLQIQPLLENRKQTDAQKLVRASGVSDEDAQSLLRGAIPGAAPTATQKEYASYRQQELGSGRQPLSQFDYDVALSKAKANSTKVEVGGQEKTYDADQGKTYSALQTELQTAGRKAPSTIATLNEAERLMNTPGFVSGVGTERFVLPFKQIAAKLGGDPNAPAAMESVRALANKAVTDQLGGSLGAGVSNSDVSFLQKQNASLDNSLEANRTLIGFAKRLADRQTQVAEFARQYAKGNGNRLDAGFDGALAEWAKSNPVFPEANDRASAAQGSNAPAKPEGAPAYVPPKVETQTDRAVTISRAKEYVAKNPAKRDAIIKALQAQGIPTDAL